MNPARALHMAIQSYTLQHHVC